METAEKLERHIRASGLKRGDKYITATHAARLMGTGVMTTQRAMTVLAQRNILERHRKAGSFIGSALEAGRPKPRCIHFLLPEFMAEKPEQEIFWDRFHGHIQGLRRVLPDLSVQLNFIPNQDVAATEQIVSRSEVSGAILVLSSRAMRAFFNGSGIPTVVNGYAEPDLGNLSWVASDQVQTGRLLAAYLLERGHRCLATVMRNVWSIGEHLLHDGINETLAEAGLGPTAIRTRSAPLERAAIESLVRELLTREPQPPTGFICRTEFQAECVSRVAAELGQTHRIESVICIPPRSENTARYTHVVPEIDAVAQGEVMARMFQGLLPGNTSTERSRIIPVQLCRADHGPALRS